MEKGEINGNYVSKVKNPLMGYTALCGIRARSDYYRNLFLKDTEFKSKLSKINKEISFLEGEYQKILAQIKNSE
jgi:hypothetical protein